MAKTKAARASKASAPKKEVKEYKLLTSQHIGPDHTEEPVTRKYPDGTEVVRFPSKTYRAGETVPSETDLVERFGREKFQYLGDPDPDTVYFGTGSDQPGDPAPRNLVKSPTMAPHGQVGTGYPEAVTTEGSVKQGAAGEETLTRLRERQEELEGEEEAARQTAAQEAEEAEEEPKEEHHGRKRRR